MKIEQKLAELARIVRELAARVPHDDRDAHAELLDRADALVARAELAESDEPEPPKAMNPPEPPAPAPAPAS